ncbi:hypothetical protein [Streptomyces sp. NPDC056512]|uniref:hypothetical protein n=1 Tax=Streptomyces sp. NPDC056512 TaxID=3345846 RepID=UPI0036C5E560
MAFPDTPLGLRIEIRTGTVWTDITGNVYTRDPITHSRGIRSNGSSADPATVPITINNRDGRFSPRNPMSPYYGLIGRNTPVRLSLPGGDHFLDLDGNAANYASTPSTSALNLTGDLDLRAEVSASWYQPGAQVLIGKWDAVSGQRSYMMRLEDGLLVLHLAGSPTTGASYRFRPPPLPERAALRVTFKASNGSGGSHAAAYWAPSLAGPWTLLQEADVTAFAAAASTAPLVVAPEDLSQTAPRRQFAGKAYRFEVRSGIDGPIVAAPDFTQQPLGSASMTDSAGCVWGFSGTAAVADRQELFVGEIAAWPQTWVPSGADAWTTVEAAGILRRYGQGAKPLDSTLRRRIPSGAPIAYWPMEEEREATRAYSPIKGVSPAAVTGVEFAAIDTLPSSSALPRLSAAATLSAIVPANAGGQWQVELVYNADDKTPPQNTEIISISTTGTVRRWSLQLGNGVGWVYGYDSSGTAIVDQGVSLGPDVVHGWMRLRFWVRQAGGTVTWGMFFQDPGGDAGGISRTVTGTTGAVTAVTANWGAATEGWAIGHLSVLPEADSSLYNGSDNGYSGESAWERMLRLGDEENVPIARIAGPLPPERVGPQRPETLLGLLQDAADADGGMLLESRGQLGLLYRDRSSLYTQEPALVLDYQAGQIAPPLDPVDDDTATRNDITVTRQGGSSARAVLESGPLSVQAPPDGIGLYNEGVTLNVDDDVQPESIAYWRLHLGTYDGARYPSVRVLLHRVPELIPAVLALREGDVIRLKNLPPWTAFGDVDLIVTGYSETLLPRSWTITFTCLPGGPWMTAKASHPVYGKADTDGSGLAGPITATDTAVPVRTTAGPPWTTDPQETPFEAQFGGEVARVDAVGQLLNPNPWLDAGLSGWVGQATGSVALSTEFVHPRATVSVKVIPNGSSGSNSLAMSSPAAAVAGRQYTGEFWVYFPLGGADVRVMLDWFNASGGSISTTSGPATVVPAGVWTYLTFTATAPALTTAVVMRCREGNSPTVADVYYVWGERLLGAGGGSLLLDTFGRAVASGWGNADTGQPWTVFNGSASDFSVNGSQGVISHTTRNVFRYAALTSLVVADVETVTQFTVPAMPTGDSIYTYVLSRTNPVATSYYFARVEITTAGVVALSLRKRNPAESLLATAATTLTHVAGQSYKVRFRVEGSTLSARFWVSTAPEPTVWHATATDTDPLVPAAGGVGFRSFISTTNTNALPVLTPVDDVQISDSQVFTVTRSVNGVVKSHAAGTPFSLAHPAIASL